MTVPKAGHFVPNWINNYKPTFQFLKDMMNNDGQLACAFGANGTCSVGSDQIAAMNNCSYPNGVANMTTGQCQCDSQSWKGGDCGLQAHQLLENNDLNLTSTGPTWFSLFYNPVVGTESTVKVTIKGTSVPLDVYVSAGWESDPNKFTYDAKFADLTSSLTLNSSYLPVLQADTGFAISIYVDGIATKQNELLTNAIEVSLANNSSESSTYL